MTELSLRERMRLPRIVMPEQDPARRRWNFEEVNLGLDVLYTVIDPRIRFAELHPLQLHRAQVAVGVAQ